MKSLLVSIGNTNTVAAFAGSRIRRVASFPTSSPKYPVLVRGMLQAVKNDIQGVAISSVVPRLNLAWRTGCKKAGLWQPWVLTARSCTAHKGSKLRGIAYSPQGSLGADRIANALGAIALYPSRNRIVVDAGTAVTIDVVDSRNRFVGGLIMPGIELCLHSLTAGTSLLPRVHSWKSSKALGNTTTQCMGLGVDYMVQGGIALAVDQLRKKLGFRRPVVIATGGNHRAVQNIRNLPVVHEPDLQLMGLYSWLQGFSTNTRKR